ncbi:M28 family peptidase [Paracoccus alcaliphilus]|uniref:M28 family peptidase n=1 Tax=Paracoccus alcaliphilus TaxID=34002 RepID=UPI001B8C091E|nr:M28 family peptidase [Paracoccus alcaliphilus]
MHTLASFGRYQTGVHRPSLSPQDIAARQWFASRLEQAGLSATIDGIGNVIGRKPAGDVRLLAGSHLETVAFGGWLDGALGCVLALEAARILYASGKPLRHNLDVAAFFDEEGHFGSFLTPVR